MREFKKLPQENVINRLCNIPIINFLNVLYRLLRLVSSSYVILSQNINEISNIRLDIIKWFWISHYFPFTINSFISNTATNTINKCTLQLHPTTAPYNCTQQLHPAVVPYSCTLQLCRTAEPYS